MGRAAATKKSRRGEVQRSEGGQVLKARGEEN